MPALAPEPQAAVDPLAALIAEYRRQNQEFTKRAPHEDW